MAGLVSVGRTQKDSAKAGLKSYSKMQKARKQAGDAIEAADKQTKMSAVGMGASIGMAGGPVGALIGAGVGYLAASLF